MPTIATLDVPPFCLGGNVFGWTADEEASFAVLDRTLEAFDGRLFVDSADVYSAWADGHGGGESEAVLGRWIKSRGVRGQVVVATKVGMKDGLTMLDAQTVRRALQASLDRLGIEQVDLYYAHTFDEDTPLADTVAAFGGLVEEGLVRHVAASNHDAAQLAEGLRLADEQGVAGWVAVQNGMSLVRHETHGADLAAVCRDNGVAAVPYGALAGGFLTGKYTPGGPTPDTPRAERTRRHLDAARGPAVLAALGEVAAGHGVPVAAVAVAWVAHQDAVVAPIASARSAEQLEPLLTGATLELTSEELDALTTASRLPGAD